SKYDAAQRELADPKKKIAELEARPKHHYQLREQGLRTFRFDPDTGDTCIKLTIKADWKNPETTRQGCAYQDDLAAGTTYAEVECWHLNKLCDVVAAANARAEPIENPFEASDKKKN